MSNKIHDAFAGLHMDPARSAKIEHALRQAQAAPGYTAVPFRENRRSRLFTLSAAACLLAVILLGFALLPRITAPAQELAATDPEIPTESTPPSGSEAEREETERMRVEANVRIRMHTNGDFLCPVGNSLYFNTNGEMLDITDLISDDEAFTYVYAENGIIHYIAVGGCYTPGSNSLDGVYYGYWYRDEADAEAPLSGWLGGNCSGHWSNAKNDYFGWYLQACDEFGIPWQPRSDLDDHVPHSSDHHHHE